MPPIFETGNAVASARLFDFTVNGTELDDHLMLARDRVSLLPPHGLWQNPRENREATKEEAT